MDAHFFVAHRGDNTNYPENSYAGIEAALKAGAHYVEFDIQMNASGSLVVLHDTDFNRTAHVDLSIFDLIDDDLDDISVHQPDKFERQHYPSPVPFLKDIVNLFKHYPSAKALVELKTESIDRWGLEKIMAELLEALKDSASQAIIISFGDEALTYAQSNSQHKVGLVFEFYNEKIKRIAQTLRPQFMICPYNIIPENPHKETVWQDSWQWMLYSINDEPLARKLLKRGDIDLIETDNINLMLEQDSLLE